MEKKSGWQKSLKKVQQAFVGGFDLSESSKEKNVLKAALKGAQKRHPDQPVRLLKLKGILAALQLTNPQMGAFLETDFIGAFMEAVNQVQYDPDSGRASGDPQWWAHTLKTLLKTCGPDAARTLLSLCDEPLASALEGVCMELGLAPPTTKAHVSPQQQTASKASIEALAKSAVDRARQACLEVLVGEFLPSLNLDDKARQTWLGNHMNEGQREAVLLNKALNQSVAHLVKALKDSPDSLNEMMQGLGAPKTVKQEHFMVVCLLMVYLMKDASEAKRPFDLPAFVAALAQAGFPSIAMRLAVFAFEVVVTWPEAFKGQLLDSIEGRLCATDVPPQEKQLWTTMVSELHYKRIFIGWTPSQQQQLDRLLAYLRSGAPGAMIRPSAPTPVPGNTVPDPASGLGSGAPDTLPVSVGGLLENGLAAMKHQLGGFVHSLHYQAIYANTALGMVSDDAVRNAFDSVWKQWGEGPDPLEVALSALEDFVPMDRALILFGLLHTGLASAPEAVDLQAFIPRVFGTMPGHFMTALAAILVNGHPTKEGLARLVDGLVALPETAQFRADESSLWMGLLKEVRFLANKWGRLEEADKTKLNDAINSALQTV